MVVLKSLYNVWCIIWYNWTVRRDATGWIFDVNEITIFTSAHDWIYRFRDAIWCTRWPRLFAFYKLNGEHTTRAKGVANKWTDYNLRSPSLHTMKYLVLLIRCCSWSTLLNATHLECKASSCKFVPTWNGNLCNQDRRRRSGVGAAIGFLLSSSLCRWQFSIVLLRLRWFKHGSFLRYICPITTFNALMLRECNSRTAKHRYKQLCLLLEEAEYLHSP